MKAKIGNRLLSTLKPGPKPYEVRDSDLNGFLIRVQPSGVMSYAYSYRMPDGRKNRIVLGKTTMLTPAQARDLAEHARADLVKGQNPAIEKKRKKADSLGAFIEKFYRPWAEKPSNLRTGSDTLKRLESRFADFLSLPLDNISVALIRGWRNQRLDSGIKPATINRDIAALQGALTYAASPEIGLIKFNPLTESEDFKPLHVGEGVVRYLSEDEDVLIRSALDNREERLRQERRNANEWRRQRGYDEYPDLDKVTFADRLKPLVLISLNTGLRRGELFKLRWEFVDLKQKSIAILGTTTKTMKTRHIPLNDEVFSTFSAWHRQNGCPSNGFVFPSYDGTILSHTRRSWEAVLKAAGIEKFRWHDMRHDFASKLVMAGVDLNTVRELLGHSDIKMTLKYAHLAPHAKAKAVAKLNRKPLEVVSYEQRNA